MAEKEKRLVEPTHYPPYERKGKRRTAPARATGALASTFFPAPVHSRAQQIGFLGMKARNGRGSPLWERLEKCADWLENNYKIVFVPREQIDDLDDYECLMVTQSAISDFTLDSFIYSVFSEVHEMSFLAYPFNLKREREHNHTDDFLEKFDAAVERINFVFWQLKREMKKIVENDAYFLNSQFRSHTIWFLEKFFSQDLTPPDIPDDRKVQFEVLRPPPLPEGVENAFAD